MPNGPHRITGLPFEEELYSSEHSVKDADIQVRLSWVIIPLQWRAMFSDSGNHKLLSSFKMGKMEITNSYQVCYVFIFSFPYNGLELGLVAQRITRLTTDQKIVGSNPTGIDIFFNLFKLEM